jgi:hypothetical protein
MLMIVALLAVLAGTTATAEARYYGRYYGGVRPSYGYRPFYYGYGYRPYYYGYRPYGYYPRYGVGFGVGYY